MSECYGVSLERCVVCGLEESGFGMVDVIPPEIRMDRMNVIQ